MTLREFVEEADKRLCKMFRKTGEVLPMIHLIDGDDNHVVMPIPPGDRSTAMALIRALFNVMRVKRYLLVNEELDRFAEDGGGREADAGVHADK